MNRHHKCRCQGRNRFRNSHGVDKSFAEKSPAAAKVIKAAVAGIYEPEQMWLDALQMNLSRVISDSGHLERMCCFLRKKAIVI